MVMDRRCAGCGFIKVNGTEPGVIVAGGRYRPDGALQTSEIFLIGQDMWISGPALPRGFDNGGYMNPDDQTFILVAGQDGIISHTKDILRLNVTDMNFETLPGHLQETRERFALGWMIDDDPC